MFFFLQKLIECTPKNHLGKHRPTQNNPLVVICNEYWSTSKYQVERKQYVYFYTTEICCFVHLHIIIILLLLFHLCTAKVIHFFELKTIQPCLLSPSTCPRCINQPVFHRSRTILDLENFLSSLHHYTIGSSFVY